MDSRRLQRETRRNVMYVETPEIDLNEGGKPCSAGMFKYPKIRLAKRLQLLAEWLKASVLECPGSGFKPAACRLSR